MDYRRPPITEAVIELRPAEEVDRKTVEAAAKALKSQYFYEDAEKVTNVEINPQTSQATSIAKWLGIKLSSIDRTELQLFRVNSFVCSSLAPYPGWDLFRDRAKQA